MATALEQLRYIDEQLANAALPSDQAELVRVHRLTGLQLRNQRLQGKFKHPNVLAKRCDQVALPSQSGYEHNSDVLRHAGSDQNLNGDFSCLPVPVNTTPPICRAWTSTSGRHSRVFRMGEVQEGTGARSRHEPCRDALERGRLGGVLGEVVSVSSRACGFCHQQVNICPRSQVSN